MNSRVFAALFAAACLFMPVWSQSFTEITTGVAGVYDGSSSWGDYDSDGDLDLLITGNAGSENISKIYRNDSGTFTDINAGLTGVYQSCSEWGDIDNDGDLDLIIAGDKGAGFVTEIYINGGGFFYSINTALPGVRNGSVAWGDYDNDGDPDILISGSNTSVIYRNDNGVFADIGAGLTVTTSSAVSWADYDNDNDLDVFVSGINRYGFEPWESQIVSTLFRNNSAVANTKPSAPTGLSAVANGSSVTFSWTAAADAQTSSAGLTYNLCIGPSSGSGSVKDPMSSITTGYRKIPVTGNAGQKLSWTVNNYTDDYIYWGVQAVDNSFAGSEFAFSTAYFRKFKQTADVLTGLNFSSTALGDYDNDGDLDILISGYDRSSTVTKIYRNDSGVFTDINAGLPGIYWSSSSWGDFDNDGDLDILLSMSSRTTVYRNNGNGTFTDTGANMIGVYGGSSKSGDYDNDGDLDVLVMTMKGSAMCIIYRNDEGFFTDINAGLTGLWAGSTAWGDYDSDGDLDILLTGSIDSGNSQLLTKIYRNENGIFSDINAGLPGVYRSAGLWCDYDNDGDLDILLSGYYTAIGHMLTKIYRNNSGIFTDINAAIHQPGNGEADWGDFNNDGRLDVFLSGYNLAEVYLNNGNGTFSGMNAGISCLEQGSVACGDLDNDGDLDIVLSGEHWTISGNASRIIKNLILNPNSVPNTPAGLAFLQDADGLHFSFNPATDPETPSAGLSYNIDINIGDGAVKSASSDLSTGYKRIPSMGNIQQNTSYTLHAQAPPEMIPQQLFDMTWKVQSVDKCFAGSIFSTKNDIVMNRYLITVPKETMVATDALTWEYVMPSDSIASYTLQMSYDSLFTDYYEKSFPISKDIKTSYFGVDLQSLDIIDSLQNNEKYFWRVKPEHVNAANNATGFKRIPDSFIYNPTYSAPSPVSIAVTGNYITLTWGTGNEEEKGTVYNVYSSSNPYAQFPAGWTFEAAVNGTEWTVKSTLTKKFYCVTAAGTGK